MKLLRVLLLGSACILAVLAPHAGQPTADAGQHSTTRIYWVYYRPCPHYSWTAYGGYYSANQAAQAAAYFRSRGYEAFYR